MSFPRRVADGIGRAAMTQSLRRADKLILVVLLLAGCVGRGSAPTDFPPVEEATSTAVQTLQPTVTRDSDPVPTGTPTPDPCTGWVCPVRGVVYAKTVEPGNELGSASVTLNQFSYCSPTRGEHRAVTGPDGSFEFEVFFHDTDRVRIQVESEGYDPGLWDSKDRYCLFCSCFGSPLEIVVR